MADPKVAILITAKDLASKAFVKVGKTGSSAGKLIADNWKPIAAGAAAAGAAIEVIGRKAAITNEALAKAAYVTGQTSEAMRELALDTANVTFPLDEAIKLFDLAGKQGLKSAEGLKEYATFWDTVGDASGESSVELANAGKALKGMGIEIGEEGKALEALGFILTKTTMKQKDFLMFIDKAGPDLREMGIDINNAAGILGTLEGELGLSARTARSEFIAAVTEAKGDVNELFKILGVTADQVGKYTAEVGKSGNAVQDMANIHAESFTIMQKIQFQISKIALEYGALFQAATILTPVLIGVSVAVVAIGTVAPHAAKALIFLRTQLAAVQAQATLTATSIGLIGKAIAVVGVAAIGWQIGTVLTEKFASVRKAGVLVVGGLLTAWELIKLGAEAVWIAIVNLFERGLNKVKGLAASVFSELAQGLQKAFEITGIDALESQAEALFDIYDKIDDSITETNSLQDDLTAGLENNRARIEEIRQAGIELMAEAENPINAAKEATDEYAQATSDMAASSTVDWANVQNVITGAFDEFGNLIEDAQTEFEEGGLNTGTNFATGLQEAQPIIADAMNVNLDGISETVDSFDAVGLGASLAADFGAGLQGTEVELPTPQLNAAIAGILRAQGPVAVSGGPTQSAQQLMAVQAAQLANLQGFADGGIFNKATAGIIGEEGPEAVVPLDKFNMGGKTIVNNLTINIPSGVFQGSPSDMRILARALLKPLNEEQARG